MLLDTPEDQAICLFAGLLANPDSLDKPIPLSIGIPNKQHSGNTLVLRRRDFLFDQLTRNNPSHIVVVVIY